MLKNIGYLELIIGPMFSGKTSKLLEIYKQCKLCNINVLVVNYSGDTRYPELSTHDKRTIPCIKAISIQDILDNHDIENVDTILINEGQFFEDIELVRNLVDDNKRVYVCGLDGDFERKKIGKLLDLIPYCDEVYKLKSLCSDCKNSAIFSYRITEETDQIVIGSDNYVPLRRQCYEKKLN